MKKQKNKKGGKVYFWLIPLFLIAVLLWVAIAFWIWGKEEGSVVEDNRVEANDAEEIVFGGILPQTDAAGTEYIKETFFLGDSNTERLYMSDFVEFERSLSKTGIGVKKAYVDAFISYEDDDNFYTMSQAVALNSPKRIVLTFGTNDIGWLSEEEFIESYLLLIREIEKNYPYCDIIINLIPPIARVNSYPHIKKEEIDAFNKALLKMCEEQKYPFLNSFEELSNEEGYAKEEYFISDGIHLSDQGLQALIDYVDTHAYHTADRRPAVPDETPKRIN